ncbi:MAG: response regulator [Candidatus Rokubacteria bacterium]|nr:response regulator [Candidatus Rokubacteria bacterium]
MLGKLLTQKGYQTRSVGDGAAAVRAVIDEAPDVVLLDIAMPRLGGIEALTAIRAIAPGV